MIYPFLKIELKDLYRTLERDGAKNFYIRVVEPFSIECSDSTIVENNSADNDLNDAINSFKTSLDIDSKINIIFAHNIKTKNISDFLEKGIYKSNFNKYSLITNLITTSDLNLIEIELLDIYNSILSFPERIQILKNYFPNNESFIYYVYDDRRFLIRLPEIIECTLFEIGPKMETLIKNISYIFHHIEIVGNKRYAVCNPYLLQGVQDTGVELYSNITENEKLYNQFLK